MSKGFKINTQDALFKGIANKVHNLNDKEGLSIKNIDIALISRSDKNFFELRDIDTLVDDIKANGLYHNLVVRSLDDGTYELISGERRFEALKRLDYTKVPCLIKDDINDVDSEIMLIQANKNTRELTEKEKAEMIKRLEELYKQKKANGEKITGKVRDKIGEDMGLSPTQVHRYSTVNKSLIPELKDLFNNNDITLKDSFDFARMGEDQQRAIYEFLHNNINASKGEIKALKEELQKKDSVMAEIDSSNKKLSNEVNKLREDLAAKETEVNSNIKSIEENLRKELEKEIKEQNNEEITKLNNELINLKTEKENIEKEKNIYQDNTTGVDPEAIKYNAELNVTLQNIKKSTSVFNQYSKNISQADDENKQHLIDLKKHLKSILNVIEKIDH